MTLDTKMLILAITLLIIGWVMVFAFAWGWFPLMLFLISMVVSICGVIGVWE